MANSLFIKVDSNSDIILRNDKPEGSSFFHEIDAKKSKSIRAAVTRFSNAADTSTAKGEQFAKYAGFLKNGRLKLKANNDLAAKVRDILTDEAMPVAAKARRRKNNKRKGA